MGQSYGLSFEAMRKMSVGSITDYCIEGANQRKKAEKEEKKPKRRKATQADWDSFFG
jgi:hypothetical protein